MDTHAWYEADAELVNKLLETNDYPVGDLEAFFEEYANSPVVSNVLEPNATPADYDDGISRLCARYDASVHRVDQKIGTLINALQNRGIWDETALFVLSDHGESLDEHGIYFDHHGLYDETIHVPLIARVPDGKSGRVDELVQLHDLAPTTLDLLDIDGINDADSYSLAGYLHDDFAEPTSRDCVFLEEAHTQRRRAVRTNQYKYIEHVEDPVLEEAWNGDSFRCGYCDRIHGEPVELYDLTNDPAETENIANQNEDVVNEMRSLLDRFKASHPEVTASGPVPTYEDEEEVLDRLEKLGYR